MLPSKKKIITSCPGTGRFRYLMLGQSQSLSSIFIQISYTKNDGVLKPNGTQ